MSTRTLSVVIVASFLPFCWILTDLLRGEDWLFVVGNLMGFLGAVVLWWQFALGIPKVRELFTKSVAVSLKAHIWLGTYGLLFVLLHAVLELFEYNEGVAFLFIPSFGNEFYMHLGFGQIAFLIMIAVWVTSVVLRRSIKQRSWLYVHYLSYPAGFLAYAHALDIGTYLNSVPWLLYLWYGMSLSYTGMVLWRLGDVVRKKLVHSQ